MGAQTARAKCVARATRRSKKGVGCYRQNRLLVPYPPDGAAQGAVWGWRVMIAAGVGTVRDGQGRVFGGGAHALSEVRIAARVGTGTAAAFADTPDTEIQRWHAHHRLHTRCLAYLARLRKRGRRGMSLAKPSTLALPSKWGSRRCGWGKGGGAASGGGIGSVRDSQGRVCGGMPFLYRGWLLVRCRIPPSPRMSPNEGMLSR